MLDRKSTSLTWSDLWHSARSGLLGAWGLARSQVDKFDFAAAAIVVVVVVAAAAAVVVVVVVVVVVAVSIDALYSSSQLANASLELRRSGYRSLFKSHLESPIVASNKARHGNNKLEKVNSTPN